MRFAFAVRNLSVANWVDVDSPDFRRFRKLVVVLVLFGSRFLSSSREVRRGRLQAITVQVAGLEVQVA